MKSHLLRWLSCNRSLEFNRKFFVTAQRFKPQTDAKNALGGGVVETASPELFFGAGVPAPPMARGLKVWKFAGRGSPSTIQGPHTHVTPQARQEVGGNRCAGPPPPTPSLEEASAPRRKRCGRIPRGFASSHEHCGRQTCVGANTALVTVFVQSMHATSSCAGEPIGLREGGQGQWRRNLRRSWHLRVLRQYRIRAEQTRGTVDAGAATAARALSQFRSQVTNQFRVMAGLRVDQHQLQPCISNCTDYMEL